LLNELHDLFKSMVTSKGNRGVINHKRFIARIRAGNALFNNDEHHDSHEFISWLIDEIHMNIHEDYRFYIKKKLQSKEYQKDFQKFVNTHEGTNESHPLFKFYNDKLNDAIANNQGP
jgi:ubiquitin C-terminal hydrolase